MTRSARDGRGGFALIESLAVLALSALVLLTLLMAADLVTRSSAAAARRANDMESLATGFGALRRDLAGAKQIRIGSPDGPLLFQGGPTSLGVPVDAGAGGDKLIWIATEASGGRQLLVRSEAPLLPQTSDFAAAGFKDPAVLLSGAWSYRFSYAGSSGETLSWTATWSDSRRMPAAIRLDVTDRAGRQVLAPLVMRLHADAVPECRSEGGSCDPAQPAAEDAEGGDDAANPAE